MIKLVVKPVTGFSSWERIESDPRGKEKIRKVREAKAAGAEIEIIESEEGIELIAIGEIYASADLDNPSDEDILLLSRIAAAVTKIIGDQNYDMAPFGAIDLGNQEALLERVDQIEEALRPKEEIQNSIMDMLKNLGVPRKKESEEKGH